jgi:hypothetical protein
MDDLDKEALVRHLRGATVVHKSPFSSIEVPSVQDALSIEECEKWVVPFYRVSFRRVDNDFIESLRAVYPEIAPKVVERLLTDYNWRPRLTGAFFAVLKRFACVEDQVGRLLLRSDLCFAGKLYCAALAEFNTPSGMNYLRRYLEYYLTRPELDYDQLEAMGAVAYLDEKNGTNHLAGFLPLWNSYFGAKSWKPDIEKVIQGFAAEMSALHECRAKAEASN